MSQSSYTLELSMDGTLQAFSSVQRTSFGGLSSQKRTASLRRAVLFYMLGFRERFLEGAYRPAVGNARGRLFAYYK